MGSTPVSGGLALPLPASTRLHKGRIFSPSPFSSSFKSSEGLAPFVALDVSVLRAHFNRRRSAAGFEMGGSEGASSLPG